jgi:hypothetical protein
VGFEQILKVGQVKAQVVKALDTSYWRKSWAELGSARNKVGHEDQDSFRRKAFDAHFYDSVRRRFISRLIHGKCGKSDCSYRKSRARRRARRYGTIVFLTLLAFANLKVAFINNNNNNNNGAYKKQKIRGTLASEGARYLFLATSSVELGGSTS